MATAIALNKASNASAGHNRLAISLPRCSLQGRSGARHARAAARGSAPPIPYAARRARVMPGRDGKAGSLIELESGGWLPLTTFHLSRNVFLLRPADAISLRR